MKRFSYGCICSGISAATVAWKDFGWSAAWFAEIEKAPSAVLAHHYPNVPNMGDMRTLPRLIRLGLLEAPDALVGGTPCQSYSIAGLRGGLTDARGQLTLTFVDLANAIDERRPGNECIVYWENVPGVLSDKTNAFGCLLAGLAGEDLPLVAPGGKWPNAGAVFGPQRAIAWRVTDAQYFGVAQRRRRLFLVASARDGVDPAKLLFEFDGLRRDTAPRRGEGQEIAGTLAARTDGGGFPGSDEPCSGYVQAVDLRNSSLNSHVAHSLQVGGHGVAPGNTPHVIAFNSNAQPDQMRFDPHASAALTCSQFSAVCAPVAYAIQAGALRINPLSGPDGVGVQSDIAYTLEARAEVQAVAFAENSRAELRLEGGDGSRTGALSTGGGKAGQGTPMVAQGLAVRRLTPRECERLQGFPDDYTLVPNRGKPMKDGPRYKALGNSMCVKNMRWLGERLIETHPQIFSD